jgi:hypothetical protein
MADGRHGADAVGLNTLGPAPFSLAVELSKSWSPGLDALP